MSDERLLAFSLALADCVHSGLPFAETLRFLSRGSLRNRRLADAALLVSQGKTLHESLGAQGLFPPIFIALIRAGEESGKVDEFLGRFSASLETRIDFRRRLNRALVYPTFAAVLAGAIFVFFSTKAAPMLLQPIVDAGVAMPADALLMIRVGEFIVARWPSLLGLVLAAAAACWSLLSSRLGRKARALAGHWLPGARYLSEEARFYQLEATLELLLGAGLRPREMMEIMLQCFRDDPVTFRRLSRGSIMLSQGKTFTESIGSCLSHDDRPRVAVAEVSGRLDETLGKLAKMHRDRHLHRLRLAVTAIQISSIVALAPVCFALIMCILWPALSILSAAGNQLMGSASSAPSGAFTAAAMPKRTAGRGAASSPITIKTQAALRFNESNAGKVVDYMRTHTAGAVHPNGDARSAKPMPKLKPRSSMNRIQFRKIETSAIKSALD